MRATPLLAGLGAALAAALLAHLLGGVTPLPPVFHALLIGMVIGSTLPHQRLSPGADFASREILRFGVALLGSAITFREIAALGWSAALVTVAALAVTLAAGALICRALGESRQSALVSAAAVAICGASAALAVAAAFGRDKVRSDEVARIIAGITIAGTVAMFLIPSAAWFLDLSPAQTGLLLGGSIHEVAQATASGFAVSEEVGKVATVAKMLRVACMGAIVLGIGLFASRTSGSSGVRPPLVPGFVVAFILLAAISSTGLVPPVAKQFAIDVSRWCLLVAIAALGMRTSSATLVRSGLGPMLAIAINSLIIAALMAGGVMLIEV